MKYVIMTDGLQLFPIVFKESQSHCDFKSLETDKMKIVSAGFCILNSIGTFDVNRHSAYSESLGIETFNVRRDESILNECKYNGNMLSIGAVSEYNLYGPRAIDKNRCLPEVNEFSDFKSKLRNNKEVFVFGSNTKGMHMGGAAKVAKEVFNAEMGIAEGITGNSYAIPTMYPGGEKVKRTALLNSFKKFLRYVVEHEENIFYLTAVGCGIAGWDSYVITNILQSAIREEFHEKFVNGIYVPKNLHISNQLVREWEYLSDF